MKKTTNNSALKGHLKISTYFIRQDKKVIGNPNSPIKNSIAIKNGNDSSLVPKRKAPVAEINDSSKKKRCDILERELTPERKPSTSECDISTANKVCTPTLTIKSPEQLLCAEALAEYYSPEKKSERFIDKIKITPRKVLFNDQSGSAKGNDSLLSKIDEMARDHRTTPKKRSPNKVYNSVTKVSSKEKTPNKRKSTSKKLYNISPNNVETFKVEILEKFVTITPSKSQRRNPDVVFVSSSEKKQCSILKYISPPVSARSVEAQNKNESTPKKQSTSNVFLSPSTRVKTKLDFSDCRDSKPSTSNIVNIKKPESPEKDLDSQKELPKRSSPEQYDSGKGQENNLNISNLEFCFTDDWQEEITIPEFDYKLDLTESQHCKIVKIDIFPSKKVITVQSTKKGEQAVCTLEDFWFNIRLAVEDTVHISAKKLNEYQWIVNNEHGLIVYEPDFLLSATSVVNTLWCKRRSVLSDCFRGFEPPNKAMLLGSLVHTLLQNVLKNKIYHQNEIELVAKDLIKARKTISDIYQCDLTVEQIEVELMSYVPKIISFIHLYVKNINTHPQTQTDPKRNKDDWKGTIDSIDDIEENIWSPELGIKGKIDVSIRSDKDLMPLEVKTGRATVSLEHRGQVLMYIMMMNKLGYKVPSGLLLYLREGVLREIPPTQNEKRDIILMRNELAYFLTRKPKIVEDIETKTKKLFPPELPEPINHRSCAKCPYNLICTAYAKYNNEDISSMKPLQSLQDEVFCHLQESHLNYFMHWVSLLALESGSNKGSKDIREIYTLSPEEREKNGKCIINLKVNHIGEECNGVYEHTFERANDQPGLNFFSHGIVESNYVVVSIPNRPAIAAGFVTGITSNSITVTLDRNINKKYKNQTFHIDSYDSSSIQSYNLTCLMLLLDLTERGEKLRRIVIDRTPPTFKSKLPKVIGTRGKGILKRLNYVQQRAVLKAIAAEDYFLIEGMPGTGKTATIVALIQLLVELGKSVLITSHTHSAVDNVCIRLVGYGVKVLRLGSTSRIHPSLKEYSEHNLTKDCTKPEQLEAVYNDAQVIAVTCLGSSHPILSKRTMDICIVDESTQVVQSSVIRPLHSANTFILIGDPHQLPAVVKSREALDMGMSESLFERLYTKDATIALNLNYRMNTTITTLANHFTYDGKLKIGNDTVAKATLNLPNKKDLEKTCSGWLLKALDDSIENAVQFLDTGPVWKLEHTVVWRTHKSMSDEDKNESSGCVNVYEAAVVYHLVNTLLEAGVRPANIGVIATFRVQVAQISLLLQAKGVDISTVDQFQGKDKNVIIYSSSKSRDTGSTKTDKKYELLEDQRRLTVAITRAKHKLIVVGDISTLREYSTFKKILPYLETNLIRLREMEDFNWDAVLNIEV